MAFLGADENDTLEGHQCPGQSDSLDLPLGLALQLSDLCLSQGNTLRP